MDGVNPPITLILCGHVNHGKSTLARLLATGLCGPTERTERAAFFHLRRPDGGVVTLVDLPGHARFFDVTAGGAFGADAAIVAVDAQEGPMPQTREHLALLRALGIDRLVVAITRVDRVPGETVPRRRDAIVEDLQKLRPEARLVAVHTLRRDDSAAVDALRATLLALSPSAKIRAPLFRLRIDRLFHKPGLGTIAAGTVEGETLEKGATLEVAETGVKASVRSVETYGKPCDSAGVGTRAALRLGALSRDARRGLAPGMTLARPGELRAETELAGRFLPYGPPPRHGAQVRLILGHARYDARYFWLWENYARVRLHAPAAAIFGDRAVLLADGRFVGILEILTPLRDPLRPPALRRLLEHLEARDFAAAFALLSRNHPSGLRLHHAPQRFGLSHREAAAVARGLPDTLLDERNQLLYAAAHLQRYLARLETALAERSHPLLSPKSVAAAYKISPFLAENLLNALADKGILRKKNDLFLRADMTVEKTVERLENDLVDILMRAGIKPPSPNDIFDRFFLPRREGKNLLFSLASRKKVVSLGEGLFTEASVAERMKKAMTEVLEKEGFLDIQAMKNIFGLSRKTAVAWLEWLDNDESVRNEKGRRKLKNFKK